MRVQLIATDPPDVHAGLPLRGIVISRPRARASGKLLIRLDQPLVYRGISCTKVIASARTPGADVADLATGTTVVCAVVGLSDESAGEIASADERGVVTFIANVIPIGVA